MTSSCISYLHVLPRSQASYKPLGAAVFMLIDKSQNVGLDSIVVSIPHCGCGDPSSILGLVIVFLSRGATIDVFWIISPVIDVNFGLFHSIVAKMRNYNQLFRIY